MYLVWNCQMPTLIQIIISLSEFNFWCRKVIPNETKGGSTSNWNPRGWIRLDLIFMTRDIYINFNLDPITKFSTSKKSTEFKDDLLCYIPQMIMKTIPITTRIVISYTGNGVSCFEIDRKMETKWSEFPSRAKAIAGKNTTIRKKINQKKQDCVSKSGIQPSK